MRLIDADAFKELLGTDTKIRETFCKVIDAQPTAYDVEKVVAELEEEKNWYEKHGCNEDFNRGIFGATNHAIGIVKRGGVE